jgi:hypothetical protein
VSNCALRRVACAIVSSALGLVKVGCPKIPVEWLEEGFLLGSSKKVTRALSSTVGGSTTVAAVRTGALILTTFRSVYKQPWNRKVDRVVFAKAFLENRMIINFRRRLGAQARERMRNNKEQNIT